MVELARKTSQALYRASLYANELAINKRLTALSHLATALSKTLDHTQVANVVVELGTQAAGADTCTLYLVDETWTARSSSSPIAASRSTF